VTIRAAARHHQNYPANYSTLGEKSPAYPKKENLAMELITRRHFLIGALTGLTLSIINRHVKYMEEFGEPLLQLPQKVENTLYINKGQDFMIGLNKDPLSVEPPKSSLIEYLVSVHGETVPVSAADYEYFEMEYGYEATDLVAPVPETLWLDDSARIGPRADAYHFLKSFEFGSAFDIEDESYGSLSFYDGPVIGSDYLGVHADDELSISLLQNELNSRGANTAIKIV